MQNTKARKGIAIFRLRACAVEAFILAAINKL
jgi:hypothetical protein